MSGIDDLFEDQAVSAVTLDGITKHVRELSGVELYEVYEKAEKSGTNLVTLLLTKSVCDPQGRQLATEKDIRRLPKRWIDAFFEKASELNGMGDQGKNSGADQDFASS